MKSPFYTENLAAHLVKRMGVRWVTSMLYYPSGETMSSYTAKTYDIKRICKDGDREMLVVDSVQYHDKLGNSVDNQITLPYKGNSLYSQTHNGIDQPFVYLR